jgi:thioredoxin-dependent peroxiredoxin
MALKSGDKAPEFSLPDQGGVEHRLADQKGKWTLLYFYPKDDTPGCTKEACALRDNYPEFAKLGIDVFGVSTDTVVSHEKFALKFNLPFTLLADSAKKVVLAYGVGSKALGIPLPFSSRTSFLIDPELTIAKIYDKVKPEEHAQEVLRDLETLKG